MCDAEKDWHERSFLASGALNGCQKCPLDEPEIKFSFFIFGPPVVYYLKAFLIFLNQNSILFFLLEYHSSISVGSGLNLSDECSYVTLIVTKPCSAASLITSTPHYSTLNFTYV